jgi:hypothetical protein
MSRASQTSRIPTATAGPSTQPGRRTPSCDYHAPAGLFVRVFSGRLRYQSFEHASLAVQHANERLSPKQLLSCTMEVGDVHFGGEQVQQLYLSASYPLEKTAA